jgi:hypothetical protein
VETVDGDTHDGPPLSTQYLGESVGEPRLARTVGSVDRHPDAPAAVRTWHARGDVTEHVWRP